MSKIKWSKFQDAVFDDVENGTGHTAVLARAGTGKTTTITYALNHVPEWDSWLLTAFNKRIAAELKRKAPETGDIRTLHSLGLRAVKQSYPDAEVNNDKTWEILNRLVGKDRKWNDVKVQLRKAVSLCKGSLVDDPKMIDVLLDEYDIDTMDMDRNEFINTISQALLKSFEDTRNVDFDDMIWFPNVYDMKVGNYQRVFVDECQDMNPAQIELALKAAADNGRITVVGDPAQAIYGFRGADTEGFERLIKRLNAKVLPLPITYRCPLKVVKQAQTYVPDIQPRDKAPEGTLEYINSKDMLQKAKPGCFILSRINAPLIGLALKFIAKGTPCNIQGRDIGANLVTIIKKSRRKTIPAFLAWLEKWERSEIARLSKIRRSTVPARDKAECLRTLADACTSVAEMKNKIQDLFEDGDDKDRVILSTVHRAKGLERDVVFILNGTFFGGNQEERNIKYVAVTRSASELYFVTGGGFGLKKGRGKKKATKKAGK